MPNPTLLNALLQSLDDARVSRGERRALRSLLRDYTLDTTERSELGTALTDAVAERMSHPGDQAMIRALADALSLLAAPRVPSEPPPVIRFGPADPMVETLEQVVRGARTSLDIAVFTITDDRLAQAIQDAHDRKVRVRILTDDDKAGDRGSDVDRMARHGVPVRFDHSRYHFHHKFAVVDGRTLVTGSYNWTRGADRNNRENYLVSWDAELVTPYAGAFDAMWDELG